MKKRTAGKHTLLWWMNAVLFMLLCVCAAVLLIFTGMSLRSLFVKEIETQKNILKLNVDNIDGNLAALENYLLQTFSDSEEIVNIETSREETKVFLAKQSLVRSLKRIIGWNESLKFLFCYSPGSREQSFLRVSSGRDSLKVQLDLEKQVKEHIDRRLEESRYPGDGYLLAEAEEKGYVVRFYKIRNSYFGMCLDAETILKPLEELEGAEDCTAFLCDTQGRMIFPKELQAVCPEDNGRMVKRQGIRYLQLNYLSQEGDFYVGTWTKIQAVTRQNQGMSRLILMFVFGVLMFLAGMSLLIRRSLYEPIRNMEKSMKRVGSGEWDLVVPDDTRILEYDSMIRNFNEMVSEIKDLKIEKYEKELDVQKLYLQYLQMQVNPHFYLNALNIIYSMAQVRNFERVQEMTMGLVEYSRYMFREPTSLVTISQEMEHVLHYMKIQQIRFIDRIEYQTFVSSEIEDALIPPFIIQSFVENSIKYGANLERKNKISVQGRLNEVEGELYAQIEIRDNGRGYSAETLEMLKKNQVRKDGRQVGIRNVKARLALVFGDAARVMLKNENGAVAVILIPLVWQEE